MRCINDFEDVSNRPVVGLIDYLSWKRKYDSSGRTGDLSRLFCAAFQVQDQGLLDINNDLIADGIIRSNYCYDDLVS